MAMFINIVVPATTNMMYFSLMNHKYSKLCPAIFKPGSVLLRFTKIPGVLQVFSRLILNFPGVKTIPILSIADRISYKYVCYLS